MDKQLTFLYKYDKTHVCKYCRYLCSNIYLKFLLHISSLLFRRISLFILILLWILSDSMNLLVLIITFTMITARSIMIVALLLTAFYLQEVLAKRALVMSWKMII